MSEHDAWAQQTDIDYELAQQVFAEPTVIDFFDYIVRCEVCGYHVGLFEAHLLVIEEDSKYMECPECQNYTRVQPQIHKVRK